MKAYIKFLLPPILAVIGTLAVVIGVLIILSLPQDVNVSFTDTLASVDSDDDRTVDIDVNYTYKHSVLPGDSDCKGTVKLGERIFNVYGFTEQNDGKIVISFLTENNQFDGLLSFDKNYEDIYFIVYRDEYEGHWHTNDT